MEYDLLSDDLKGNGNTICLLYWLHTYDTSVNRCSTVVLYRVDTQDNSSSGREGLMRVGQARQGSASTDQGGKQDSSSKGPQRVSTSTTSVKPTSVSDSLGAAMPGSFLTATDLQELARVYVVCLK